MTDRPRRIVVMGPSGSGKSAVGAAVAAQLDVAFIDADHLHPAANIAKMTAGQALDDEDRGPWLDAVAARLADAPGGLVVACSALTRRYRERVLRGCGDATFVELRVSYAELERRMTGRAHFMPPALLRSQVDTWQPLAAEEPGVSVDGDRPLESVIASVMSAIAG